MTMVAAIVSMIMSMGKVLVAEVAVGIELDRSVDARND
jgi:hypothetical protein